MNAIEATISDWPGIVVEPHRFGGQEFTLQGREIGHHHDSQLIDIPFAKRIRDILLEEGRAQKHHVYPDSGWISYRIGSDEDVDGALWLLRLSYLYHLTALKKRENGRVETDVIDIDAELAELDVGDELKRIFSDLKGSEPNTGGRKL